MEQKKQLADKSCYEFAVMSCAEIERTAKTIMRDTQTNPDVSYGSKGHHPSLEGHPPAPDTGTLLQSITHSVDVQGDKVIGEVGSLIKEPNYPKFLEFGTSKMKPRPWLSTSLIKCQDFMNVLWGRLFRK